jgi:hypothetical protein
LVSAGIWPVGVEVGVGALLLPHTPSAFDAFAPLAPSLDDSARRA